LVKETTNVAENGVSMQMAEMKKKMDEEMEDSVQVSANANPNLLKPWLGFKALKAVSPLDSAGGGGGK
jgi:hypothetical protein